MSNRCEKCGEKFDSERGLHIHQSQMHKEESDDTSETDTFTEEESRQVSGKAKTVELGIKEVALIFFVLGTGIGFVSGIIAPIQNYTGTTNTGSPSDGQKQELPIEEDTVDISNINESGEPVLGDSKADVTMVMYEDFQCPFCQRFENNAFQKIESNYVETGKVKVVWKDFPLPQLGHNWAEPAAAAMECVYRQDNQAFWNIKDKVFDNQRTLTQSNVQSKIKNWAEQEGVSSTSIQSCLKNGNPMKEVNQDKKDGESLKATLNGRRFVGGTPSFVIYGDSKGTALSGALPYQPFQQVIEKELKDSK